MAVYVPPSFYQTDRQVIDFIENPISEKEAPSLQNEDIADLEIIKQDYQHLICLASHNAIQKQEFNASPTKPIIRLLTPPPKRA